MKIKLTIELDLPDTMSDWNDSELRQVVFDEYVNFSTISHLSESIDWKTRGDSSLNEMIAQKHHDWSKICNSAVWEIDRVAVPE